jgi:hypothetical protein
LKRAYLNLRHNVPERIEAVTQGLQKLGYYVTLGWPHAYPRDDDVLVTWNRIHEGHTMAKRFAKVLVMENASWGNGFHGRRWYTMCRDYHNRADCIIDRGPERWAALDLRLPPMRDMRDGETVILPQRGIGPPGVAMPLDWPRQALVKHKGRIRRHPGREPGTDLKLDLARARRVVTWGSGAAIKALMWGIPVISEMPLWIGEQDNTERGRWEMFCRLAWAQWQLKEFEDGSAFAHYLSA